MHLIKIHYQRNNKLGLLCSIGIMYLFDLACRVALQYLIVQSSAIITRSNIVRYCIDNCRNWGRTITRYWIHKRHSIPHPNGRAMGCLLLIFFQNWPRYNCTVVCMILCLVCYVIRLIFLSHCICSQSHGSTINTDSLDFEKWGHH